MTEQDSPREQAAPGAPKPTASQRRRARSLALQALYQRHVSGSTCSQIEAEFMVDNDMSKVDGIYFRDLLRGVHREQDALDREYQAMLDRPLQELDPIELAILRIGVYELKFRIDVPYKVVLNEGIELAKKFGGAEGHKYINSILDKLCRRLRLAETGPR
ncbi:MAG: transcription antitermination factor NusB [Halomonadaceae bacterium]|nr:MAG: transcription antitermination factor NusB [Halomonadaceae bacterium]